MIVKALRRPSFRLAHCEIFRGIGIALVSLFIGNTAVLAIAQPVSEPKPSADRADLLDEIEQLDPAIARAIREFNLDDYTRSLPPVDTQEILRQLEPIPTLEEVLDLIYHPANRLAIPTLPDDIEAQVQQMESQTGALRKRGYMSESKDEQDRALDEALRISSELLELRRQYQGGSHWHDRSGRESEWHDIAKTRVLDAQIRCVRAMSKEHRALYRIANEQHFRGLKAAQAGDMAGAQLAFECVMVIASRLFPEGDADVANNMLNLAYVLSERADRTHASPLTRQGASVLLRLVRSEHPSVATALNNLAADLEGHGETAQAEALMCASLMMTLRVSGEEEADLATTLNNLGIIRQNRNDLARAEPLFRAALMIYRRCAPGHPNLAVVLGNLAFLMQLRGDLPGAEALYRESLAMQRRLYRGDNADMATSLTNIAWCLAVQDRLDEAEAMCRESFEMRKRLFPAGSLEVAMSLNNIASLLLERGNLEEAEPLFREALSSLRDLSPGDSPMTAQALRNLGHLLHARGDLPGAESYLREAVAMRGRLSGDDDPNLALALEDLALVLTDKGDPTGAEPLCRQALDISERLRTNIVGGESERALFAGALSLSARAAQYGACLVALDRGAEVLDVVERGRSRSILDLLERGQRNLVAEARTSGDSERAARLDSALAAEQDAIIALRDAEARFAARNKEAGLTQARADAPGAPAPLAEIDREISDLRQRIQERRNALANAHQTVLVELHGLFPAGSPKAAREILASLTPSDAILEFVWSDTKVLVITASAQGTSATLLANGRVSVDAMRALVAQAREALANPTARGLTPAQEAILRDVALRIVPGQVAARVADARHLVIVPDGPLAEIPFEPLALAPGTPLEGKEFSYAPSATMYALSRHHPPAGGGSYSAVVVGAPQFELSGPSRPEPPKEGAFLAMVAPGGNAARAGIERGDVLVSYNDTPLSDPTQLRGLMDALNTRIKDGSRSDQDPVNASVWRDGRVIQVSLRPGRMEVGTQPGDAAQNLRSMQRVDDLLSDDRSGQAALESALDIVRLHAGALKPLPGSRAEAQAVGALLQAGGAQVTSLIGEDASPPRLRTAVGSSPAPRYLHLATHGLMGSSGRPQDACLALRTPSEPTADDIGFLTLDELTNRWAGMLQGCELVTLSACDTGRGVRQGDTLLSLPIGFFVAGAPTVIASLWKVDDSATALLMTRMYQNLLGATESERRIGAERFPPGTALPKLAALREAQLWLRSLTSAQRDAALRAMGQGGRSIDGASAPRNNGDEVVLSGPVLPGSDRPYAHPSFWSAFVLIGRHD